jgi:large subunit ribosomal protein L19
MDRHALIKSVESGVIKKNVADVRVGETVKVHYRIREGNKERLQVFEGLVIATKSGTTLQGSFTVRKVVSGVGVERTFPLHSPWVMKIERVKSGKVRRAKLNFVRKYALSSKFKLKDKGKPGSVWEDVVEQQEAINEAAEDQSTQEMSVEAPAPETTEEVAQTEQTADNTANDTSEQTTGEPGGTDGGEAPAEEKAEDSQPEPAN